MPRDACAAHLLRHKPGRQVGLRLGGRDQRRREAAQVHQAANDHACVHRWTVSRARLQPHASTPRVVCLPAHAEGAPNLPSCSSSTAAPAAVPPVVVRPRPIWQLNTRAAPSGGAQHRWISSSKSRSCTAAAAAAAAAARIAYFYLTLRVFSPLPEGAAHLPQECSDMSAAAHLASRRREASATSPLHAGGPSRACHERHSCHGMSLPGPCRCLHLPTLGAFSSVTGTRR